MRMPMMTGYQRDPNASQAPQQGMMPNDDATEAVDNPQEDALEGEPGASQAGPSAGSAGGRTGADVIAGCLAQGNVCTPSKPAVGAGTTGPQGDMSYGSDAGYGA